MYGTPKDVSKYRPFGCQAWVHLNKDSRENGKHTPRALKAVYLGFEPNARAWSFYIPEEQKLWSTNHAQFDEHTFPFRKKTIIDKYQMDRANHVLFQEPWNLKWTTCNKLHTNN